MREAQDSRQDSNTPPREQRGNSSLLMIWCFAAVLRPGLRHPFTTAAGAAAGTEFHSIRFRTRDIANTCPA